MHLIYYHPNYYRVCTFWPYPYFFDLFTCYSLYLCSNTMITSIANTDGHHKLTQWKLVTHCGIDGYTRLVVYLQHSIAPPLSTVSESY